MMPKNKKTKSQPPSILSKKMSESPNNNRDHSFRFKIGTLVKAMSEDSFEKHNFLIITGFIGSEDKKIRDNQYMMYSQATEREWKMPCWVVNLFYMAIE